jgi:hypothetical protein
MATTGDGKNPDQPFALSGMVCVQQRAGSNGTSGTHGTPGNEKSVTYRFQEATEGSNPSLSAINYCIQKT